jgi:hypothetical protein
MAACGTNTKYRNEGCRCAECKEAGRVSNAGRKSRSAIRLPIEPLLPYMGRDLRNSYRDTIRKALVEGLTIYRADVLCCRIGRHPWEIYGDLWFQDLWEDDNEQAK